MIETVCETLYSGGTPEASKIDPVRGCNSFVVYDITVIRRFSANESVVILGYDSITTTRVNVCVRNSLITYWSEVGVASDLSRTGVKGLPYSFLRFISEEKPSQPN